MKRLSLLLAAALAIGSSVSAQLLYENNFGSAPFALSALGSTDTSSVVDTGNGADGQFARISVLGSNQPGTAWWAFWQLANQGDNVVDTPDLTGVQVDITWTSNFTGEGGRLTLYNNNTDVSPSVKDGVSWALTTTEAGVFQTDSLLIADGRVENGGLDLSGDVGNNVWFQFDFSSFGSAFPVSEDVQIWVDKIEISIIPEPSTYAALLGLLGFGLVVWRRFRRN